MMPFFNERRLFFKRDHGAIQKSALIFVLGGVLLFSWELAAQYGSGREQVTSRLAFAPQGFEAYQTDNAANDRKIISTRVPKEAPLSGSFPNATSANLLIVTPENDVRSDDDARVRVRLTSRGKAPTGIFNDGVSLLESKQPAGVVKAIRGQRGEPRSATASVIANEPSERALTTLVKVDQDFGKAKPQPKVAKPRQVSAQSRRPRRLRRRAKRPSISAGQSPYQDAPKWARKALFNRTH